MIRIEIGDCREILKSLPDKSVHCCVTSPPYYGLRRYLPEDSNEKALEIGTEQTPEEYVSNLVDVFREVKRVLRDDGQLWLNLGDSYSGSWGNSGHRPELDGSPSHQREKKCSYINRSGWDERRERPPSSYKLPGLKPKDLIGIPWLIAKALQAPYYTGNIKDEKDRTWLAAMIDAEGSICGFYHERKDDGSPRTGIHINITNSDERILQKAFEIYPSASKHVHMKNSEGHLGNKTTYRWHVFSVEGKQNLISEIYPYLISKKKQAKIAWNFLEYQKKAKHYGKTPQKQEVRDLRKQMVDWISQLNHGVDIDLPSWMNEPPSVYEDGWYLRQDIIWSKNNPMPESVKDRCTKAHEYVFLLTKSPKYFFDAEAIKEKAISDKGKGVTGRGQQGSSQAVGCNGRQPQQDHSGWMGGDGETRNKRSVWQVNTKPYKGAHFATFPLALVELCIKAGTSARGVCSGCGSPYLRIVEKDSKPKGRSEGGVYTANAYSRPQSAVYGKKKNLGGDQKPSVTVDWKPPCSCNAPSIPATVLDPFGGSGTVGEVCNYLGRNAILIELNPDYKHLILERTSQSLAAFDGGSL